MEILHGLADESTGRARNGEYETVSLRDGLGSLDVISGAKNRSFVSQKGRSLMSRNLILLDFFTLGG